MGRRKKKRRIKTDEILEKEGTVEKKGLVKKDEKVSFLQRLNFSTVIENLQKKLILCKNFLGEVGEEVLRKVSWPNRKTVLGSTVVVIIFVLFVALFIAIVDGLAGLIINLLIGRR